MKIFTLSSVPIEAENCVYLSTFIILKKAFAKLRIIKDKPVNNNNKKLSSVLKILLANLFKAYDEPSPTMLFKKVIVIGTQTASIRAQKSIKHIKYRSCFFLFLFKKTKRFKTGTLNKLLNLKKEFNLINTSVTFKTYTT